MSVETVARRYAAALADVVVKSGETDAVKNELKSWEEMIGANADLQIAFRNPAIAHQLLKFAQTRLCGEHMEFLAKVNNYHVLLHEVSRPISGIYEGFFQDGATKYLNVPQVSRCTGERFCGYSYVL